MLYAINKKTSFFLHMGRVIVMSYLRNPWKADGFPVYWSQMTVRQTRLDSLFVSDIGKIFQNWLLRTQSGHSQLLLYYTISPLFS